MNENDLKNIPDAEYRIIGAAQSRGGGLCSWFKWCAFGLTAGAIVTLYGLGSVLSEFSREDFRRLGKVVDHYTQTARPPDQAPRP